MTMQVIPPSAVARRSVWRKIRRMLMRSLLIVCIPLAFLAFTQRRLIYLPGKNRPDLALLDELFLKPFQAKVFDITATTEDQITLHGWLIPAAGSKIESPADLNNDDRPVAIWFNGNAGNRLNRLPQLSLLHQMGVHTVCFEYRGYAGQQGSPSEEGLAKDARAIWKTLHETLQIPARRIRICGESLGGGVATRLVSDLCQQNIVPGGLMLQATFTSLVDAGAWQFPFLPVNLVLFDRFPSRERIASVTCPILVIHGERDTIVPVQQGQQLFDAAPAVAANGIPKHLVRLPDANHNDILEPSVGAVDAWTDAVQTFMLIP